MTDKLNLKDLDFILESLKYTKLKFEEYDKYPPGEFKQKRINEAQDVIVKIKALLDKSP